MKHFNDPRIKKVEFSDDDNEQPQEAAILSFRNRLVIETEIRIHWVNEGMNSLSKPGNLTSAFAQEILWPNETYLSTFVRHKSFT